MYRSCEYTFVEISPELAGECEAVMRRNHPDLCNRGQIKILNGSILDVQTKVKDFCFVVGMEILDNMPHDRLFKESYSVEGGSDDLFTHYSTIEMMHQKNEPEQLVERLVSIKDKPDPLISLYLRLLKTMPELDSVEA